jgi:hypothetical protein
MSVIPSELATVASCDAPVVISTHPTAQPSSSPPIQPCWYATRVPRACHMYIESSAPSLPYANVRGRRSRRLQIRHSVR